jgi:hypothetical protein
MTYAPQPQTTPHLDAAENFNAEALRRAADARQPNRPDPLPQVAEKLLRETIGRDD